MATFYDELFPGLDDDKEIKEAIKLISKLDKVYEDFISGTKSLSSQYKKNVNDIIKTTRDLDKALASLDATSEENRKEIAQISKAADVASASYEKNSKKVKELQGSVKVLVKEQSRFNQKSKETIKLDLEKQKLTARLSSLSKKQSKEIAELRVQIQKKTAETKKEARETLGLVSIYEKQSDRMKQLANRYKDLVVAGKQNTAEAKRLKLQHDQLRATILRADQSVGQFTKNIGRQTVAMKGLAVVGRQVLSALGFTGIIFGLIGVFKSAVRITKEYEQENAKLAGVLAVTREETKELQEDSKRLGATTRRTATQVVQLQIAYARLGFTQSEILDVTEATIDGSIALNAELDDTATLVGALIRTFDSLDAADAEKILDKLTISTQQSSNSFETLSTSLPKVAGAANALGVSLEDVLAQLGVVQDATQDASIAGTSLRNIYLVLAKTGLTLDQALDKISNSQDKVTAAVTLFDKRSAIAALALANQRDRTRELREGLEELGVVQRVVKEQNDTLAGSLDFATSAWQGLVLSVEEGSGIIGGLFRGIIDTWTTFLTLITAANEGTISWGEAIGALQNPVSTALTLAKIKTAEFIKEQERSAEKQSILNQAQFLYAEALENGFDTFDLFVKKVGPALDQNINKVDVLTQVQLLYNESLREMFDLEELSREGIIESLEKEIKLLKEKRDIVTSEDEIEALNMAIKLRENELNRLNELGLTVADKVKRKSVEVEKAVLEIPKTLAGATTKVLTDSEKAFLKWRTTIFNIQQTINQAFGEGLQLATDLFVGVTDLFAAMEEKRIQAGEKRIEDLEIQRERELTIAGDNVDARIAIEDKFNQRIQQIEADIARRKRKQAVAEKAAAIAQATIDTALAVSKTLGQTGFLGIPLAAIVGALGALQIATIAATPIPQFEKGTENAPGGLAMVGEKGRELVMEPSGKTYLTGDKAELRDIPEGSKILTNAITENILNKASRDKEINEEGSQKIRSSQGDRESIISKRIEMIMERDSDKIIQGISESISNLPVSEMKFGKRGLRRDVRKGSTLQTEVQNENRFA